MENDEAMKLVRQLIEGTNATLASHAAELRKINENLVAAFNTMKNYGEGIMAMRTDQEGLGKLVNAQTKAFDVMRDVVVKHAEALENHTTVIKSQGEAIVRLFEIAGQPLPWDEPPAPVN